MKNKFKSLLGVIPFLFIGNSGAALIDNGAFTSDTTSGLDWYDLSFSTGRSYNDVASSLGAGQDFDGWSIATFAEIGGLFDAAGGSGPYYNTSGHASVFSTLYPLWGIGSGHGGTSSIWAHTLDTVAGGNTTGIVLRSSGYNAYYPNGFSSPTTAYSQIGTALIRSTVVSPAPIPEPSILALMGLGLAGLGFARRRRNSQS